MRSILRLALPALLVLATWTTPSTASPADDCFCAAIYDPVCGSDGHTYSSSCDANCANVQVVSQGDCPSVSFPCMCTSDYTPVCGEDGVTYSNQCNADCAGVQVGSQGECQEGCMCSEDYPPVCGENLEHMHPSWHSP